MGTTARVIITHSRELPTMHVSRTALLAVALPFVAALTACGGGSAAVNNITGSAASVRFVNGTPGQSFDVYYTTSG